MYENLSRSACEESSNVISSPALLIEPPAEVGKQAIRERNERATANKGFKVLAYDPETKDVTIFDGWAVEWRQYTASFVASPGGEPTHARGTVLGVYRKMPDDNWKAFRAIGFTV